MVTDTDIQPISTDIVVVGGGLAGVCAAISAARGGASVTLVQERPVFGGNSSSEIRVHPVGASQHGKLRDARETGIMEELFLEVRSRSYGLRQINGQHYPMWDVVIAELVDAEPNISSFLNTRVITVETNPSNQDEYDVTITGLVAVQQGSEGVFRFTPSVVIDATGDGFVALQAGAPFRYGREASDEFDESWAPKQADDVVLGSTIMFAARDVGREAPFAAPSWAHQFPDENSLPFRNHDQFDSGYWWLEWGGRLNTITDNEEIRRELHAAVFGVWDHIKNQCTVPGVRERASTWTLDWIGHTPGKRESRRFEGDHILTERDLIGGMSNVPHDVVAYGGWPIDLHAPDGVYSPDRPCTQPPLPGIYGIPLRSLYSRTVDNLFLAGRDISQSHVAHGSTRVMKTCAVIGEAAGTAAAVAAQHDVTPREVAQSCELLTEVQQALLRNGAYLPLRANQDDRDLVRTRASAITATSVASLEIIGQPFADSDSWEVFGISTAEHSGVVRHEHQGEAKQVELIAPLAQMIVLSEGELRSLCLELVSDHAEPQTISVHIRQASHLRDPGQHPSSASDSDLATFDKTLKAGRNRIELTPDEPLQITPTTPCAIVIEAAPEISWVTSPVEPPGTQAAQWDTELGYWRWLHGTFVVALDPVSRPYSPEQVRSGVTRPEMEANLWISDPHEPLPQSLTVQFDAPQDVSRVELTFDSQLSGWIWEGRFPMVPKDYRIEFLDPSGNVTRDTIVVSDSHQRRRSHDMSPVTCSGFRIAVLASNGASSARIVEVRAYA